MNAVSTLDRDEVMVAVPADAEMPTDCREVLESYATRPILRRADVGTIYVVASYRLAEIEAIAARANIPLKRLPR